jgi:hypothetical protein
MVPIQLGGERRLLVATKERHIVSIGCKDGLLTCDIIPLNLGAHLEVVAINGFVRARDSALVLALTLVQVFLYFERDVSAANCMAVA